MSTAVTVYASINTGVSADFISFCRLALLETVINFVFLGAQTAVFVAAMAASARHESRSRTIIALVVALLLSSMLDAILCTIFIVIQFPNRITEGVVQLARGLNVTSQLCIRFNFLASDVIVVWRAWVLWQDCPLAKGALTLCMVGSILVVIVDYIWEASIRKPIPAAYSLMVWVPVLFTNVVATIFVAFKYWHYRRDLKDVIGLRRKSTRVERLLALLLESGLAYCFIVLLMLALTVESDFHPDKLDPSAINSLTTAYHIIAGIYPTFIVLIVSIQRSSASSLILSQQISHAIQFADADKAIKRSTTGLSSGTAASNNAQTAGGSSASASDINELSRSHRRSVEEVVNTSSAATSRL
ncbi:hypothetical protein K525DRAFT_272181 [Schizophyllum commune Loenen D]|nr:hypothetical protein K525DRAFT_272181 [Schizophyllum commune Loenen D]